MGCFSAETNFELPSYLKGPSKQISSAATSALKKPFTPYTGQRVADMSGTQNDVMEKLKSILGMNGTGGAIPRVIDNIPGMGPAAGSTQDYMDPFLEQVLGPVTREINLSTQKNLQTNDASAHMAGAFGDTGHGLERSNTMEKGTQAISDATGRLYSSAYNDAMNRKSGDIDRMMTDRNAQVDYLKNLFNMGGVQQGTEQAKLDANFQEFMRKQGYDLDTIAKVAAIIGGLPQGQMTQTPSTMSSVMGGLSTAAALFI